MNSIHVFRKLGLIAIAGALSAAAAFAQSSNPASEQLKKSMDAGMRSMQGMKLSGDTDMDFAMMMKMHHQQALEMAKVQVQQGRSAPLKTMAQKIIDDQTKEIAQLDAWMQQHHR
ncbi:DUF305 domain-containing protein [Roseateles chitinivorans]|uniref:DUF305 domain-containing protein n=1 Tax=Roseateles chitinivorans TaxID=2917965 RepID=UPI003D66800B